MIDTGDVSGSGNATASAGETGSAADAVGSRDAGRAEAEVIVGEIPDAEDLTRMLWTARCTVSNHGLLGTYPDRETAEAAKQAHLVDAHGPV
jgi:hypothetical protein